MKYRSLLVALLLLPSLAFGQVATNNNTNSPGGNVTVNGTTKTLAAWLAPVWNINVADYGGIADLGGYTDGVYTAGSNAFSSASTTFSTADVGKPIWINGAGTNGHTLSTTIASYVSANAITLTANAVASSSASFAASGKIATAQSSTGSYAPSDTVTLTGGTFSVATVMTVLTTKVVSATINAAGSGGTNGHCTLTGTTGTGRLFRLDVTVAGGVLSVINGVGGSLGDAGSYTVNPTSLAAEPVTGCTALSGATVTLKMGVSTDQVTTPGIYSVAPTSPVSQGSTSGSGTGATFTMAYDAGGTFSYGTDNTAAISAAVARSNALFAAGAHSCIYFPAHDIIYPNGTGYLVASTPTAFSVSNPGCVTGIVGEQQSIFRIGSGVTLFAWDDAWFGSAGFPTGGGSAPMAKMTIGPWVSNIAVFGDTDAAVQQNAFMFYDHEDYATLQNVNCWYVRGYCLGAGIVLNDATAYLRESNFYNFLVFTSGTESVPPIWLGTGGSGGGEATNEVNFFGLSVIRSAGKAVQINNSANTSANRLIRFYSPRFETSQNGDDLVVIGDPVLTGLVTSVEMYGFDIEGGAVDHAGIRVTAQSLTYQGSGFNLLGVVGTASGYGVSLDNARITRLQLSGAAGSQAGVQIGQATGLGIKLDILSGVTPPVLNIDPVAQANVLTPVYLLDNFSTSLISANQFGRLSLGLAGTPMSVISPTYFGTTQATFATNACSATMGTSASGTVGTYTSATSGTCTVVITINGATGMGAAHGWNCSAFDWTTPADIQLQTASTTAAVTIAGTTVSGDVIHWGCAPW